MQVKNWLIFSSAVRCPMVWLLKFCSRVWCISPWMFYSWYFKGEKSLWACYYCSWVTRCWRWQYMGIIQGVWTSYFSHYWRNWLWGGNFSSVFLSVAIWYRCLINIHSLHVLLFVQELCIMVFFKIFILLLLGWHEILPPFGQFHI